MIMSGLSILCLLYRIATTSMDDEKGSHMAPGAAEVASALPAVEALAMTRMELSVTPIAACQAGSTTQSGVRRGALRGAIVRALQVDEAQE
jgi:hypothetical protein